MILLLILICNNSSPLDPIQDPSDDNKNITLFNLNDGLSFPLTSSLDFILSDNGGYVPHPSLVIVEWGALCYCLCYCFVKYWCSILWWCLISSHHLIQVLVYIAYVPTVLVSRQVKPSLDSIKPHTQVYMSYLFDQILLILLAFSRIYATKFYNLWLAFTIKLILW